MDHPRLTPPASSFRFMIVGIDLGTSTSEIAYLKDGVPRLVRGRGSVGAGGVLPSVVGLLPDGQLEVGVAALNQAVVRPRFTVQEVKRLMGTAERVSLGDDTYAPQEISALILRRLVAEAEAELGERVTEAVITVPANFDDVQRQATIDAGTLAGLRVRRLINEPTAAAVAYGLERPGREAKILVYDLGGGTFDVTLLELSEGVLDVLATAGNNRLGGADFDDALVRHLAAECRRKTGVDLLGSERGRQRLKREARTTVKEYLSTSQAVSLTMENVGLDASGGPVDFSVVVTRPEFERILEPLVRSTEVQVQEVLRAAKLRAEQVDEVVFAGGSTKIPYVRQFVADLFGGREFAAVVPPDEAVALGAAVVAAMEQGVPTSTALVVTDVLSRSFGVRVIEVDEHGREDRDGYSVILPKNAKVPRTARRSYRTRAEFQTGVDVEVFQGESEHCSENASVGEFHLEIQQPGPAGQPVEVEMSINLSGMLDVVARESGGDGTARRSFPVSPVRMTDVERGAARSRVDRLWAASADGAAAAAAAGAPAAPAVPRSPRAERAYRLAVQAEKRAAGADPRARERVAALAAAVRAAADGGSAAELDALERELTDVLFDIA